MIFKLIDRLNQWAIRRLPSQRVRPNAVELTDDGILLHRSAENVRLSWDDVGRVVATRSDQYVGDTIVLVFSLLDGTGFVVSENAASWPSLTETLHLKLIGAKRFATWSLELLAASKDDSVEVYRR